MLVRLGAELPGEEIVIVDATTEEVCAGATGESICPAAPGENVGSPQSHQHFTGRFGRKDTEV